MSGQYSATGGSIYGKQVPDLGPIPEQVKAQVTAEAEAEYLLAIQKSHETLTADIADAQRRQLQAVRHADRMYRLRLSGL
jgi:hypothetical protein